MNITTLSLRVFVITTLGLASGFFAQAEQAGGDLPGIGRVQAHSGVDWFEVGTVWGRGFDEGVEVYGWNPPVDRDQFAQEMLGAFADGAMPGRSLLPEQPPQGSRRLAVQTRNGSGTVMAVTLHQQQVLWVKNEHGFSAPFPAHRAQLWWASPRVAAPGDEVRLFGRGLVQRWTPSLLVLRSAADGSVVQPETRGGARNGFYEGRIVIPENLAAGAYDIYAHNGSAGLAGWSEPVRIEVAPAPAPVERQRFDVTEFGAIGDGLSDDTAALLAAVRAAGEAGGGLVYLPAGTYGLTRTLELPEGVELRGLSRDTTEIRVHEERPLTDGFPKIDDFEGYPRDWINWWAEAGWQMGSMVRVRNDNTIRDLHLRLGPGARMAILVARAPGVSENVRIEQMRFTAVHYESPGPLSTAIRLMGDTHGLVIRENDFLGAAIDAPANRHEEAYIGYNTVAAVQHGFNPAGGYGPNLMLLRGTIRSIIEENQIRNGDRNIIFQSGRVWGQDDVPEDKVQTGRPAYHTALIGNMFTSNIPRRHNAGEIMFEGGAIFWHGRGDGFAADRMRVDAAPFNSILTDNYVLVLDGPGIGQYRRVVEHTDDTLVLDRPWDVVPDVDSYLAVGHFVTEFLWVDNVDEKTANWTGFWGGHLGHILSGQINRDGEGLYLWAYSDTSVVAFIDVDHSWVTGRGQVKLLGPGFVFGNTVNATEVIDFRRRPNLHGNLTWAHQDDNQVLEARRGILERPAIHLTSPAVHADFPATAPSRAWNVIQRNLILNGPIGIALDSGSQYNIVNRNVLGEVGETVRDRGEDNWIGMQFDDERAAAQPVE